MFGAAAVASQKLKDADEADAFMVSKAYFRRAQCQHSLGNYKEALTDASNASDLTPTKFVVGKGATPT